MDIKWPPANVPLSGGELVPLLQGGRLAGAPASALGGGGGGGGGAAVNVASYAAIRTGTFSPTATLVLTDPYKGGVFILAPPSPPAQAFAIRDNGGTVIVDSAGHAWQRVYDERINAAWFYNAPANTFGDSSQVAITSADQAANPQWIGMPNGSGNYPVGTFWDYVALQEWIYACLACRSTPHTPLWNIQFGSYQLNQPGFCPAGLFDINQQLTVIATGANLEFASRRGGVISWWGNSLGTDVTTPGFFGNSVDYSVIRNLTMQDRVGCTTALVSIDHNPNVAGFVGGLSPQLNTFENWFVSGSSHPLFACVGIALAGGTAQGDTQLFLNMFLGSAQNGVVIGGDNALGITFIGGNMTNCTRGIANTGAGSFSAFNLLTEGDVFNYFGFPHADQLTMDGGDFISSEVGTGNSIVIGNRSESMVFGIDYNGLLEVQNSTIAFAGVSAWAANAHYQIGFEITAAGNGFSVVALADDGGPPWFLGTLDSTGLIITADPSTPGLPWTVNQFANYGIWRRFGSNGFCNSNAVVSNTANTLTLINPFTGTIAYAFKLFLSSGATAPNWAGVLPTNYGRTDRTGNGRQWNTNAGSNFVQGGIAPPVGAWAMVCGAMLFTLQSVTSSPSMPGPLFGKVASISPAATFSGYIVGTTLTATSLTTGSIVIGSSVAGSTITSQLTGTPNGVGTYAVAPTVMFPTSASFYGRIDIAGTLIVTSMFAGAIAAGQTLATTGITGNPTIIAALSQAAFTAHIDNGSGVAGNTMTVTAISSGALAIGQTIFGAGVPTGTSAPTIINQSTGTTGGLGTYGISGGTLLVASEAMTSVTTGVGNYSISDTTQTTPQRFMTTGVAGTVTAMSTGAGFSLVDNAGHPVNAGVTILNGQGYWGQPIVDGGLIWIPIDFDVLYGIKRMRGCQISGIGKVSSMGEIELDAVPQAILTTQYLRDVAPNGEAAANYRPRPDIGLTQAWTQLSSAPLAVGPSAGQIGSGKALYYYTTASVTLNLPALQGNVTVDFDLILQNWAVSASVITWGTNVRPPAPTLTLGAGSGPITIVHLRWWGLINASPGPGVGAWVVTSIQGPM